MEGAIIHELNHKNSKIHDNVRPYYPGCNEIREMEDLAISHQLCQIVLILVAK